MTDLRVTKSRKAAPGGRVMIAATSGHGSGANP